MEKLKSQISSLLFIAIKPLTIKFLAEKTDAKKSDIEQALAELMNVFNIEDSGIHIQKIDDKVQMVTSPSNADMIKEYLKDETTGELTPASLETLTVIAYRGPITKTELEMIRGVHCGLILRNLLIRGLIEEKKSEDEMLSTYQVSFDFLKYIGLDQASQLPDFEKLNSNEHLQQLLNPQAVQDENAQTVSDTSALNS